MRLSIAGSLIALALTFSASLMVHSPTAAAASKASGKLHARLSHKHPDMLLMTWKGPNDETMADQIFDAYEQYKSQIQTVTLILDSPGGSVSQGERVIAVLQEIKKTAKLYTAVEAGARCASMCVFIYVQGEKRFAASASLWLFHEISHEDPHTHQVVKLDRTRWLLIVDKYWAAAGVDPKWIERVKAQAVNTNVWESGGDLLAESANLVQKPLADEQHRVMHTTSE
jgi:hypothetical protein